MGRADVENSPALRESKNFSSEFIIRVWVGGSFNGQPYDVNLSAEGVALSAVLDQASCYAINGQAESLQGAAAGVDLAGAVSGDFVLCANNLQISGAELVTASMGTWRVSGSAAPLADPALECQQRPVIAAPCQELPRGSVPEASE